MSDKSISTPMVTLHKELWTVAPEWAWSLSIESTNVFSRTNRLLSNTYTLLPDWDHRLQNWSCTIQATCGWLIVSVDARSQLRMTCNIVFNCGVQHSVWCTDPAQQLCCLKYSKAYRIYWHLLNDKLILQVQSSLSLGNITMASQRQHTHANLQLKSYTANRLVSS